jgi:tetratricopeptide (TPR) repeat protein
MSRRTIWAIIALMLCVFSCAKPPQKSPERVFVYNGEGVPEWFNNDSLRAAYYYTEAVKYAALEEQDKSKENLDKVFEIDSLHPSAHHRLGRFLIAEQQYDKALLHTSKAIAGDSLNNDFLEDYGYALSMTGNYEKARGVYRQLIVREPKEPNHYRLASILYAATGMPHMAISILDSADYKLGYFEPLAKMKRGLLLDVGLYGRAIKEAQTMVANDPQNIEHYLELGDIYESLSQDSLAEVTYLDALKISPESAKTLFTLSDFYHKRGMESDFLGITQRIFRLGDVDVELKLELYDNFVVNDEAFYRRNFFAINTIASVLHVKYPNDERVEMRYAYHLVRAGELDKALQIFKKLAHSPATKEPKEPLLTVMSIESHLGHTDSMRYYLDLAIERLPGDPELYIRKAYLVSEEGNELLATEYFQKAIDVATDSLTKSDAYTALADHTKDLKKSKKLYKKALEYNPDNAMALNNWAYYSSLANDDLPLALELSTRACELEATNATYLDTKAWILHLMGRNQEAKKVMQQAISLDNSSDPTLLLHYADILVANGDSFLAEIYYKRAAEAGMDDQLIRARLENLKKQR